MGYLCSNRQVKQINQQFIESNCGTTEFLILVQVVKNIGIDSTITNHGLSSVRQIVNIYCFTQFHAVELGRKLKLTLFEVNSTWSEQESIEARGTTWVNFCWVCVPLASQNPYPIIVYFVAKYRPYLSHFWENVIFEINTY